MSGSISLCTRDRNTLLRLYRRGGDSQVRLRAHISPLLHQGYSWTDIAAALFTSASTINRWRRRFLAGGLEAVVGPRRPRASAWTAWWVALVIGWVTLRAPTDFGFVRSRWTCATGALLLRQDHGVRVSREAVRRCLRQADLVWRRPRPVLRPQDPRPAQKLRQIRAALRGLPADETAAFADEADVNTNPKIGALWMRKGQQAEVEAPGTNAKRYLAGSLHWRTGELTLPVPGRRRNADLFLAHLEEAKVPGAVPQDSGFWIPELLSTQRTRLVHTGPGSRTRPPWPRAGPPLQPTPGGTAHAVRLVPPGHPPPAPPPAPPSVTERRPPRALRRTVIKRG